MGDKQNLVESELKCKMQYWMGRSKHWADCPYYRAGAETQYCNPALVSQAAQKTPGRDLFPAACAFEFFALVHVAGDTPGAVGFYSLRVSSVQFSAAPSGGNLTQFPLRGLAPATLLDRSLGHRWPQRRCIPPGRSNLRQTGLRLPYLAQTDRKNWHFSAEPNRPPVHFDE